MTARSYHGLAILLIALALLALAGCSTVTAIGAPAPRPLAPAPPAPAPTPLPPISLPRDEAPHDVLSEWWYYTGHLDAADGTTYGFELVIFQAVRQGYPVGYAAHFAIADPADSSFRYFQRSTTSLKLQGAGHYDLAVGDWRLSGQNGADHISATQDGYGLDLTLQPEKPPVLQGGTGIVSFGPAGVSYYYSRTRLKASGTLVVDGRSREVSGLAWMDHQWGDYVVAGGGWDWYSLQLDDGADVMLSVLRDGDGRVAGAYGTYVAPDGQATTLRAEDFQVEPTGRWTSPRTGIAYPSGWRARIPGRGLDLKLQPVLPDQELDAQSSTSTIYWDGAVSVSGQSTGNRVAGRGYVELTGYTK